MVNISTVGFVKEGNIAQGISSKIVKWSIMEVATPHYGGCQPIFWFCSYKRLFTLLKSSPKVVCSPWIPTFDECPIDYSKRPISNPL